MFYIAIKLFIINKWRGLISIELKVRKRLDGSAQSGTGQSVRCNVMIVNK